MSSLQYSCCIQRWALSVSVAMISLCGIKQRNIGSRRFHAKRDAGAGFAGFAATLLGLHRFQGLTNRLFAFIHPKSIVSDLSELNVGPSFEYSTVMRIVKIQVW